MVAQVRTVTAYSADSIYIDGFTNGPAGGWRWDGHALSHPIGVTLRLTAPAAARVSAAVVAAVPGTTETKTGYQLHQMPEADKQGYEYIGVVNEVHGIYTRSTPAVPGRTQFTVDEITQTVRCR